MNTKNTRDTFVITVSGDLEKSPVSDGFLKKNSGANLLFNLQRMKTINSGGLGALCALSDTLKKNGGRLLLFGLTSLCREIFDSAELADDGGLNSPKNTIALKVYSSEEAALAVCDTSEPLRFFVCFKHEKYITLSRPLSTRLQDDLSKIPLASRAIVLNLN